jgi:crotonobetainyl-CoA:carnitine CoA-transferase CaiB-like acyl-CoA transferase
MMLGDMGARVTKVERPGGDAWRNTAPVAPYEGRGYLGVNRGKRSIALDMEQAEGREVARRLCVEADVAVFNYRPGVAERLGLGYDALSAANPRLVYCENSAFGHEGPYAGRAGFDILSQAATGMILYENKIERGVPGYIATVAVADLTTAMFMAFAIVNALYARVTTGRGQRVESSLFASGLAAQYRPLMSIEAIDRPVREGFLAALDDLRATGDGGHEAAAQLRREYVAGRGRNNYYRIYETKDALIAIGCLQNKQRRGLRDALGVDDPTVEGATYDWFSEAVRDVHHRLTDVMETTFRSRTTAEWLVALDANDVPCGAVKWPEELYDDPHTVANGLMVDLEHEVLGTIRMPAPPVRMSETPAEATTAPPALGAHSAEVLRELGYDDDAVARMFGAGVVLSRERLTGSAR